VKLIANVRRVNLYRAMTGDKRPDIGWLGRPYGTFDNIPLLENPKFEKGRGIELSAQQIERIMSWNNQERFNWLVSHDNKTDMVLAYDETTGIYRQHTPEVSGGALVNVLEFVGNFAKIECWDAAFDLPLNLPPHLLYVWRALTLDGTSYIPRGGVVFPILYWRPWAYLPAVWLEKI
jgi:hypothetical protein